MSRLQRVVNWIGNGGSPPQVHLIVLLQSPSRSIICNGCHRKDIEETKLLHEMMRYSYLLVGQELNLNWGDCGDSAVPLGFRSNSLLWFLLEKAKASSKFCLLFPNVPVSKPQTIIGSSGFKIGPEIYFFVHKLLSYHDDHQASWKQACRSGRCNLYIWNLPNYLKHKFFIIITLCLIFH